MALYHNNMSVCAQKVRLVLRENRLHLDEKYLQLMNASGIELRQMIRSTLYS